MNARCDFYQCEAEPTEERHTDRGSRYDRSARYCAKHAMWYDELYAELARVWNEAVAQGVGPRVSPILPARARGKVRRP